MSKTYNVIHKKSNVMVEGSPKLPAVSALTYGEIAINFAKGGETLSIKNANDEIVTFSSDSKIIGQIPSVADYFDGAEYDSNSKRINFKHGNTVKAYVDATDFIKDGMVDTVVIDTPVSGANSGVTCIIVTFNTDAGKENIEIPISTIFDADNYYTSDQADELFVPMSAYTEDEEVIAQALNDLNTRVSGITVPTKTSDLTNDSGYITGYTETDPTVPSWAKQSSKPTYTASEVGAMATSERSNYLATGTTLDNIADGSTRKLANYSTTAHTHTAADVGAMATSERSNYSTTAHTHTAAEVGAMATSERSNYLATGTTLDNIADGTTRKLSNYSTTGHTHEQYATTAHTHSQYSTTAHTHTAAEVGAMSTDERGNYLATGTTLDDVVDGTTRKLANYSTTAHTHSQYSTTAHTHTAEDVGAMATSERSNYLTTATTIPSTAAEVGAMATSERNNYLPTGTTLDNIADGTTRKLSNYSTTAHTHTATEVGAMATSERSNYLPTGTTLDNVADGSTRKLSDYSTTGHTHSEYLTSADTQDFVTSASTVFVKASDYEDDEEVIAQAFNDINDRLNSLPDDFLTTATTIPSTAAEVGAMATSERSNYATTAHTHSEYATTAHTHSEYLTTATTIPSTAADVGAMATSERSNYLATGTTLDNIADGTTRKLSNYSTTAHTHSEYATTAHTHTAAEVGAVATSEMSKYATTAHTHSEYATTAHTHTAAEVGAMATSERSNYSTTAHTHTAAEVGAMATSERSNYSTTGHTHDYLPLSGGTVDNHVKVRENSGATYHFVDVTSESIEFRSGSTSTRKVAIYPYWMDVIEDGYQLYLPKKTGTIAITDDIPTEASLTSSGFTKNALTGFTETDPTVPAWAKAENKPTYTASEVGAMATSERSNYATTAHTHTAADVGAMSTSERSNYLTTATTIPTESTISGSGFTKNAITGINVNGTAVTVSNGVADVTVPSGLPAVTASDNGKVLMVVNGVWSAATPTIIYTGTNAPDSSLGNDGDIYLQTS